MNVLLRTHANVNATDSYGWTPLHCACFGGQLNAAKLLVKHKADITMQTTNDFALSHEYNPFRNYSGSQKKYQHVLLRYYLQKQHVIYLHKSLRKLNMRRL